MKRTRLTAIILKAVELIGSTRRQVLFADAFSRISCQRGMLFGADARIALVIFGVLATTATVISFGRLNQAEGGSLIKELQAVETAIQQYQNDLGSFMMFTIDGSNGTRDFGALYQSDDILGSYAARWAGPYYTAESNTHPQYGDFTITYGQADRTSACAMGTECYIWINLSDVSSKAWILVNSYYDEQGGASPETPGTEHTNGRIRASSNITDPRDLYFRSLRKQRQ